MTFRLRDNLHWCACGGRIIFLDLEADRYFCLPFVAGEAFTRVAAGEPEPGDAERLGCLIARGMLIEDSGSGCLRRPPRIEVPTADFLQAPHPRAPIGDLLRAFVAEKRATLSTRKRALLNVIRDVDSRARRLRPRPLEDDTRLRRIASASAALSLVVRAADRCLVRALALHAICARQGIPSSLVFGVRVNPFGAHCWVQRDETVLVGDFEQVRLFTPILAVG